MVGGHKVEAVTTTTPRLDIPGGLGFLHRFIPTDIIPERFVQIQCPLHPKQVLEVEASEGDWSVHSLGAIESSTWPFVTGWIANLCSQNENANILVEGFDPITVRPSLRRPDVETYLGTQGVAGFQVDVGMILGYAVEDTTLVILVGADEQLDTACIVESPQALRSRRLELKSPLVSVIVPSYQHARFLRARLDSIYGQSYGRMEVILLDDASTDGSADIRDCPRFG